MIKFYRFFSLIIILNFQLLFSAPPNWDCNGDGVLDNYNDFQNNGSMTLGVLMNGENPISEGDLFASFVGDEQRGAGDLLEVISAWGPCE